MTKGEKTKLRIIEASRELFAKLGFSAVSMADICEAAGISRGGLYAHFSSTAAIFTELIEKEQRDAREALDRAMAASIPPEAMIKGFLSSRAKDIAKPAHSLGAAIGQFARCGEEGKRIVEKRAVDSISVLSKMISLGQEQGVFREGDPEEYACGILWLIEGMSAHAALLGMNEQRAADQLMHNVDMLKI